MAENLTPKQQAFVDEYLIDLNATQAALRAGYSEDTAGAIGRENLQKPTVKAAITAALAVRAQKTKLSAEYVITSLLEVAERCMERAPVMVRRGREMVQMVDEEGRHVWLFDSRGANRALELLGKNLKLFTDKIEHSGELGLRSMKTEELEAKAIELAKKLLEGNGTGNGGSSAPDVA